MFSVIFPGQGSQSVGMAKNLYENHIYIENYSIKQMKFLDIKLVKLFLTDLVKF